jgi:hypothetical protein
MLFNKCPLKRLRRALLSRNRTPKTRVSFLSPLNPLAQLADAHHELNERDVEIEHLKTTLIAVNQKVTVRYNDLTIT